MLDVSEKIDYLNEDIKVKESSIENLVGNSKQLEGKKEELVTLIIEYENSLRGNEVYKSLKNLEGQVNQLVSQSNQWRK